jgi:hypothetical protein
LFEDSHSLILVAAFLIHQSLASEAQDREFDAGLAKWSCLHMVPPFRGEAASSSSIAVRAPCTSEERNLKGDTGVYRVTTGQARAVVLHIHDDSK